MTVVALALVLFAAPTEREKGVERYLAGDYHRASRHFRHAALKDAKSAELQLAYLFSLKNAGLAGHLKQMLAAARVMPRQQDAQLEALRLFVIADGRRRLAERQRELWVYYGCDPQSTPAVEAKRQAIAQAKAARIALRAVPGERWQPLIDRGLAACGAILGGPALDDAVKRVDSYARITAASRKLWETDRERGMVFDPVTSLPFLATSDAWYDARMRQTVADEIHSRTLLAQCFRDAKRSDPAIAQYTAILTRDPSHADSLLRRALAHLEATPARYQKANEDFRRYERLTRPEERPDEARDAIRRFRESTAPPQK